MNCNICDSNTIEYLKIRILHKYNVQYYRCQNCDFIQTELPFWLEEAYNLPINNIDVGLIQRNVTISKIVNNLLACFFQVKNANMLDYGGGYGIFVRMMRDKGYSFFRQDEYCQNLFAKHFDFSDISIKKFSLVTAIEVFEHLPNPSSTIEEMLKMTDSIFFTTELQSNSHPTPENWWYFIPHTGQHISLYSKKSIELIAEKYKLNYYSYKRYHLLTSHKLNKYLFKLLCVGYLNEVFDIFLRKKSLLESDFDYINQIYSNEDPH